MVILTSNSLLFMSNRKRRDPASFLERHLLYNLPLTIRPGKLGHRQDWQKKKKREHAILHTIVKVEISTPCSMKSSWIVSSVQRFVSQSTPEPLLESIRSQSQRDLKSFLLFTHGFYLLLPVPAHANGHRVTCFSNSTRQKRTNQNNLLFCVPQWIADVPESLAPPLKSVKKK